MGPSGKPTLPLVVSVSPGLEDLEQPDWKGGLVSFLDPGLTGRDGLDSLRVPLVPHPITAPKRVTLSQVVLSSVWFTYLVCIRSLSLVLCPYVGIVGLSSAVTASFWPLLRVYHDETLSYRVFHSQQTSRVSSVHELW